jgi:hypothetical protein
VPRLYSEFPSGYPGVGLLLLRLVTCAMLLTFESRGMAVIKAVESHSILKASLAILLIAGGAFIALGSMTTIASCVVGSIEGVWAVCSAVTSMDGGNWLDPVLVVGTLAAIILTGPGGFSLDAYFFGPRRVEIPIRRSSLEWTELRASHEENARENDNVR